jgi:hypothetical protein
MGNETGAVSPRAVEGGGDGFRKLRDALAQAVRQRTAGGIEGLSAHFGEDYEHSDDPEAVAYLTTGGQFRFLAFAFAPWRMWDLHVGIVPIDERSLSVGFHISERAAPVAMKELERLGAEIGAAVKHQPAAVEYQANLPPIVVDSITVDRLADTVSELCRKYAGAAGRLPCPPQMRADAR